MNRYWFMVSFAILAFMFFWSNFTFDSYISSIVSFNCFAVRLLPEDE